MKMRSLAILVSILALASAIQVQDCGSKLGSYSAVSVSSCDPQAAECILKRKTNVTIDIGFTTNVDVEGIKAVVHGVISGLPVPYPIPNANACVESGIACPVKAGTPQRYTATFPVSSTYPKIKVIVKWELRNEAGNDIICILIPTRIK